MGERDIRDALIERLVVSATQLWRVVLRAEAASPSGRASLALVAAGLTRSFDELASAIEVVLVDGETHLQRQQHERRR